jgi:hypothetical protein
MRVALRFIVLSAVLIACSAATPASTHHWVSLPPPPETHVRAAAVWTGRELFYWGGDDFSEMRFFDDGAMLDPAKGKWRPVKAAPIKGRSDTAVVWTGREAIVWGGWAVRGIPKADGAAYDPAKQTWRLLPPAPLSARQPVAGIWTGKEMIVWGERNRSTASRAGAAYDPKLDRWRRIADSPLGLNEASAAWTGREMVVFGAQLDGNSQATTTYARGQAYNPSSNKWRIIADSTLSPQASSVAWTGEELVAWDYELKAAAYDPAADRWHELPSLPLGPAECYPKSAVVTGAVFAWYCGDGALLDVRSGKWVRVDVPKGGVSGVPIAVGSGVVFAGPDYEGQAPALWLYRP